ncbi:MAG: CDP-diacylglycerol--glycerol-3-phosphate 3-phosphatidyltransferase [Deltaproteobacteria bacterium]|nr:CDP-diacylglycerol--glycerol-3-phosphate 3-phosphatidyltransferase [Deltaproteobacteria bacterium]
MVKRIDIKTNNRRSSIRQDIVNLPNMLTMLRIIMIPLVLWFVYQETRIGNFWAVIFFALAAVTDVIDGWLARRQGLISLLGQFLDPLADKLIILASLVAMVEINRVPSWVVIIIAARELCVTSLRTIAISEGLVISAGQGGKDKAALQNVAVAMLILHDTYFVDFWLFDVTVSLNAVGLVMLYTSLFFALTSAGEYVRMFVKAVEAKEKRSIDS